MDSLEMPISSVINYITQISTNICNIPSCGLYWTLMRGDLTNSKLDDTLPVKDLNCYIRRDWRSRKNNTLPSFIPCIASLAAKDCWVVKLEKWLHKLNLVFEKTRAYMWGCHSPKTRPSLVESPCNASPEINDYLLQGY